MATDEVATIKQVVLVINCLVLARKSFVSAEILGNSPIKKITPKFKGYINMDIPYSTRQMGKTD